MQDIELDKFPEYRNLRTHKQREFIKKYLHNGRNALQSAKDAGYTDKTSVSIAYKLLENEDVKGIIKKVDEISIHECRLTEGDVTRFWKEVLHSDKANYSDRLRSSELIAKYLKMFDDNDSRQPIFQIFTSQDINALGIQGITNGKLEHKSQVIDVNKVA